MYLLSLQGDFIPGILMNDEEEGQEHKQEAKWKGLIETTNQTRHMQKLFVYLICRQPLVVK